MAILGSHMSIAGGLYKAVERGHELGCDAVQIFTKSNNQWSGKPITDAEAEQFKSRMKDLGLTHPLAHNSYLINMASPDDVLREKSIDAMTIELQRAEQLDIPYVVAHPGAFTTSTEAEGITRIAQALDEIHRRTPGIKAQCLLETTAGQGSTLGWKFEQLGAILAQVAHPERLGVCVDTCHVFAAGYPLAPAEEYQRTMQSLIDCVGLPRIRAFHLNDSQKPFGSRVDRHAHIGHGHLGIEPFRLLLNDPRFVDVPMYLETEKSEIDGEHWDRINLRVLRGLIGAPAGANCTETKSTEPLPAELKPAAKKPARKNAKRKG